MQLVFYVQEVDSSLLNSSVKKLQTSETSIAILGVSNCFTTNKIIK